MKKANKILSVILALIMVLSIFSTTASAIGETSGTCGDNLNWNLDLSTETLTISGTGSMTDYSSSLNSPWKFWRSSIKTVIIEDGVTSIGDYSFYWCTFRPPARCPHLRARPPDPPVCNSTPCRPGPADGLYKEEWAYPWSRSCGCRPGDWQRSEWIRTDRSPP